MLISLTIHILFCVSLNQCFQTLGTGVRNSQLINEEDEYKIHVPGGITCMLVKVEYTVVPVTSSVSAPFWDDMTKTNSALVRFDENTEICNRQSSLENPENEKKLTFYRCEHYVRNIL